MKSYNTYKSSNKSTGFDTITVNRIRYHARKLSKSRFFSSSDVEDIEQEIVIYLLLRLPSYDSSRGSKNAFIKVLIATCTRILLRDAKLQKAPGHIKFCSLYDKYNEDNEFELLILDTLPSTANFYTFYDVQDEVDIETKIDVQRIVQDMPTTLGDLCALLQVMTITEIAQITGVTYWVIQKQINRLRKAFISAGIKKFA